ncbi:hypothetical protein LWI29_033594 [Acer saccharum]|uniref:RING-type E3 ubiquitin transferase n=1 Tax=Acer saccharum TaxID=4024 RepID=A0AA39VUC0_ACESA|nr:hypothetical protein LWI29_033594 [Acer saccharum]
MFQKIMMVMNNLVQNLYAFFIGSYVIWTAVARAGYSIEHIRTKRAAVFPIIMKLLTALCVPYVLARGVFPVLGYPLVVNSAVDRFAWLGCLSFSLFCFCAKWFHVWFTNLHSSIRDDRL